MAMPHNSCRVLLSLCVYSQRTQEDSALAVIPMSATYGESIGHSLVGRICATCHDLSTQEDAGRFKALGQSGLPSETPTQSKQKKMPLGVKREEIK